MHERGLHPSIARGVRLNADGRLDAAIDALKEGLAEQPEHAGAWWLLGGIYWQLGRYTEAIPFRRRATELRPRKERYSLGLFHTLLDAGLADDLIVEVRRFLSEVERGAECTHDTRVMYADYSDDGIALVAEWKRAKNS